MNRRLLLAVSIACAPLAAEAENLTQVYQDARAYDATYAAARYALQAGMEKLPQGRALLLPSVNLTASTTESRLESDSKNPALAPSLTFTRDVSVQQAQLTLTQPLFRAQNFIQYDQSELQVKQAESQFGQASQDLIVRVAVAYFDMLGAQDSLRLVRGQKAAIAEQLAQAKRNFEVGTATITDTHEAQARYDLATSQEIAAQSDLEIKKRTLQQIVGKFPERLEPLKPNIDLNPPTPNSMEDWASAASTQSYPVRAQEAAVEVAVREIDRVRAGHLPTLNIVGNAGVSSTSLNTLAQLNTGADTTNYNIGLQLAIPLYAGGNVSSLVRQAVATREKAQQDLESTRRTAALNARQSFLGVTNGMAQVKALEAALISSRSALDSNKLGYEVGVRINIDVLNAQQQVFSTLRDLSRARYDTILNGLRLKSASGTLTDGDVEEINRLLGAN